MSYSEIIDCRLPNRIGWLDHPHVHGIEEEAIDAFCSGLSEADALDVALGLYWRASSHPAECTYLAMVTVLAPELSTQRRQELAALARLDDEVTHAATAPCPNSSRTRQFRWHMASQQGARIRRVLNLLEPRARDRSP
jgi:hypothetical protein